MTRPFFTPHLARPAELLAPQLYRPGVSADPQSWAVSASTILRSTLTAWWDASDAGSIALNGADVETWSNKAPLTIGSYDVTQSTASKQPLYGLAAVNGLNAVLFHDAAFQELVGTAPVTAAGFVVWLVFQSDSITATQRPFHLGPAASTDERFGVQLSGDTGGDPVEWITFSNPAAGIATSVAGFTSGTTHVARFGELTTTSRYVSLDGATPVTDTTSVTPAGIDTVWLGGWPGAQQRMSGYICEAVVAVGPSAGQIAAMDALLPAKWAA